MPDQPALALREVRRSYQQGGRTQEVLRGVDLEVAEGETVALLGPSGSGKSTLLQIAGLLDRPDSGIVEIDGRDCNAAGDAERTALRRDRVGFVYQFHHLLPELTALENVMTPQLIQGANTRQARKRAEELLEQVGLGEGAGRRPAELSGGEQQRVAICRAVANRPAALLADEPTGNLDAETGARVLDGLIEMVKGHSMAILVATHNVDLAGRMNRRLVLREGRLQQSVG